MELCKNCGQEIKWGMRVILNKDGTFHECKPKVKTYTKEEIEEYQRKKDLNKCN